MTERLAVDAARATRCPSRVAVAAVLGAVLALGSVACAAASAAETRWWISNSAQHHAKSEARGVLVDADGVLRLGPRTQSDAYDSLSTPWSIALLPDGSVAFGGDRGRIDRWSESRGFERWVELPVGQVLSLARDGDGLVAGTGPEGLVYRISSRGDTTRLAATGERYVWGLAPGAKGVWYAGTGTRGKILSIARGVVDTLFDSEESNIVSIVSDGRGGLYAGGDSRGRIYHVAADGARRTVFEAPESEVRALAIGGDGALYAAALSARAVTQATPAAPADEEEGGITVSATASPTPVRSAVAGGKAVVYRIIPDSLITAHWTSPQPFVFALAATADGIVAATGNRAGIYLLERSNGPVQWLAAPQGQITALAVAENRRVFAVAANPGALWRIGPDPAAEGELMSDVFDAGRLARFGRLTWHGSASGRVTLAARSGNTAEPDHAWSAWQGGSAGADGIRISAPPARYLQWKITIADPATRVSSVEAAYREQNMPPLVDRVQIAPQGLGFREGEMSPRADAITQMLPGGRKVEYSIRRDAAPRELGELPGWARGLRTIQWNGVDPNGDPLTYRVEARAEDSSAWFEVAKELGATSHTWDTAALSDGRYRVRIIASDAESNAWGEGREGTATSEPFTVDNTPPRIASLSAVPDAGALRIEARAEDDMSVVARIEISLDDTPWRTVTPIGGLADQSRLAIRVRLDEAGAGEHTVSIRVVDLAGNSAVRAVRASVPQQR